MELCRCNSIRYSCQVSDRANITCKSQLYQWLALSSFQIISNIRSDVSRGGHYENGTQNLNFTEILLFVFNVFIE